MKAVSYTKLGISRLKIIHWLVYSVLFLILFMLNLQFHSIAYAKKIKPAEFLAVAIFRLSENVDWPNKEAISSYPIHIISDDPAIEKELSRIAKLRNLHDDPIRVSRSGNAVLPTDVKVVFIDKDKKASFTKVMRQIQNNPVLVISYNVENRRNIMINFKSDLAGKDERIQFEINKANLINRGMSVNPDIILLGGTEVDVAKLYRKAQIEIQETEDKLLQLEDNIITIKQQKKVLSSSLVELNKDLTDQKTRLIDLQREYESLQQQSEQQNIEIQEQISELKKREKFLDRQSQEIEKRSKVLSAQKDQIKNQNLQIESQGQIIQEQDIALVQHSEIISSQRNMLIILTLLSIAITVIAAYAIYLSRKNKQTSLKLAIVNTHLKDHAARLEMANDQLRSFSYSVSHDLRAPLRSIKGFSEILKKDHSASLDEEATHFLGRIEANAKRMDELINDILILSRLSQESPNIDENVNLAELFKTELDKLKELSRDKIVDFKIEQNLYSKCDPRLMQLAVENLVGNAWKYSSKRERVEIVVGLLSNGEDSFYIRDNGAGFDMQNADKLFEPFRRLHSEKEFEGTGIGLATVKRIINMHGGKIWAESEVNKGTTFYFTLASAP